MNSTYGNSIIIRINPALIHSEFAIKLRTDFPHILKHFPRSDYLYPSSSPTTTTLTAPLFLFLRLSSHNAQSTLSKRLHLHQLRQKQCHPNSKLPSLRSSPKNVSPPMNRTNLSLPCKVCGKQKPVQAYSKTQLLKAAPSSTKPPTP